MCCITSVWRPAYLRGGVSIDYQATSVNSVFSFLKVVISSLLVMSFISLISFGGDDGEDYHSIDNFEAQLKQ